MEVKALNQRSLEGSSDDLVVEHWKKISALRAQISDLNADLNDTKNTIEVMLVAYDKAKSSDKTLQAELLKLRGQILALEQEMRGSSARREVGEKNEYPTMSDYLWNASNNSSTYGPTATQLKCLENANALFNQMTNKLNIINNALAPLENKLEQIGAPKIKK